MEDYQWGISLPSKLFPRNQSQITLFSVGVKPVLGSQNQPILGTAGQSSDHGFSLILRTDNKLEYNVFKGLTNDVGSYISKFYSVNY